MPDNNVMRANPDLHVFSKRVVYRSGSVITAVISLLMLHRIAIVALLFAVATVSGCSNNVETKSNSSPELDALLFSELENVAECFHAATAVLQTEPNDINEFSDFLRRAKRRVLDEPTNEPYVESFKMLKWNATESEIITTTGKTIQCRIAEQSHDNYGPAGTAFITKYEFFISGTKCRAITTVELSTRND